MDEFESLTRSKWECKSLSAVWMKRSAFPLVRVLVGTGVGPFETNNSTHGYTTTTSTDRTQVSHAKLQHHAQVSNGTTS